MARLSIFLRSVGGRSQRGRLRQQSSRRLVVESIEGRLLLSVAPINPVPNPVIFITTAAPEASPGRTVTTPGDSSPSASEGGYILTGPITYSNENQAVANGMGPRTSVSTSPLTFSPSGLIQHFDQSTGAVTNDINPRVVGIEFLSSGEGGPIGLSPMDTHPGGTSDSARPLISIASAELTICPVNGHWLLSQVPTRWLRNGHDPQFPKWRAMSPVSRLQKIKLIKRIKSHRCHRCPKSIRIRRSKYAPQMSDTALQNSARSNGRAGIHSQTPDPSQILSTSVHESARWIDAVFEQGQNWTATTRKPDAVSNGIALPASYLRFSPLDRKLLNQRESASPSPDGSRVLKSAARSNASISGIFKSVSNLEPLLAVLLLDYVAARKFQQVTKKQSPETDRSQKIAQ